MVTDKILKGEKVYLRTCTLDDVTEDYIAWLNDERVNQYLETRFSEQNRETISEYVKNTMDSDHEYLFAIIDKEKEKHIGNLHLTQFQIHNRCEIAYFIGDRKYWGNGRPVDILKLGTAFAFDDLKVDWIGGGIYARNIFSLKAILKAGYTKEGYHKSYVKLKDGTRDDVYMVGLTKEDYEKTKTD